MNEPLTSVMHSNLKTSKKKNVWSRMAKQWDLQIFVIPAVILIIIFHYIPMWGVLMGFQNFILTKGFFGSPWVGTANFRMFFDSPDFWRIMRNTIVISFLRLLFAFPAPIILALMLNELKNVPFKRVVQTISYLPHFISWVIVAGIVISLLSTDNGTINELLQAVGIIHSPINWLSIPKYFWGILVTASIWKDIGFGAIIYLAAITGVDPNLYEAASMDGASRYKQILYITIPSIVPVIIILLILNIGTLLNAGFQEILLLTNWGGNVTVQSVSDIIDTYVYRVGIENARYSYATAVGLFKSVISVGLLVVANFIAKRLGETSLW